MTDPVCALPDIPDGGTRVVEHKGRQIALVRVNGEVFALANTCPHKDGPLGEGIVSTKRHEIICPWHRFRFDLRTGKCVTYEKMAARTYPVTVRDNQVFVQV